MLYIVYSCLQWEGAIASNEDVHGTKGLKIFAQFLNLQNPRRNMRQRVIKYPRL